MIESATSPTVFQDRLPLVILFFIFLITSTFILSFLYFQREDKLKVKNQAPFNSSTSSITSSPTPSPTSTPAPSPTPLQGPGTYACDPLGICGDYSEEMRKDNCTVTYADRNCLHACADPVNRCKR